MFRRSTVALLPFALLCASSVSAHIELQEPISRYDANGNKSCPCGEGGSNRICNTAPEDTSDPNRGDVVTEYVAGSTITIRFDEYINHAGRFRVAFDADGADAVDFNENVLVDVPDPNDAAGLRSIDVTLPSEPCENCTLQLIQAMHGDTENPVLDPTDLSTYYTCADIRLVAGDGADDEPLDTADPSEDDADLAADAGVGEPGDEEEGSLGDTNDDFAPTAPGQGDRAMGSDSTGANANEGNSVDESGEGQAVLGDTDVPGSPASTGGQAIPAASSESSSSSGGCSVSPQSGPKSRGAELAGLLFLFTAGFAFRRGRRSSL